MPVPLIVWAGMGLAGLYGVGWVTKETGDAIEATAKPVKWVVAGGVVYVSYKALKAAGALK